MSSFLLRADDVLRRRPWTTSSQRFWHALLNLIGVIFLFGLIYGAAMGTYSGVRGERVLQVVYSGVKVPLLLFATFLIGLPVYFVLNSLVGLRRDFAYAVRALVATQAGLAVILASFSPFTLFWYASSAVYPHALLFNAITFGIASFTAQWLLRGYYRPLVSRNRKHAWLMWIWIFVYSLVGIQMGWVLRPFVGSPGEPVQFLRESALDDNAYVVIARLIRQTLDF